MRIQYIAILITLCTGVTSTDDDDPTITETCDDLNKESTMKGWNWKRAEGELCDAPDSGYCGGDAWTTYTENVDECNAIPPGDKVVCYGSGNGPYHDQYDQCVYTELIITDPAAPKGTSNNLIYVAVGVIAGVIILITLYLGIESRRAAVGEEF